MRKIHKSDGFNGLYRGYSISVVGIIAYRALYFGLYDTGKALLFNNHSKGNIFGMWLFAYLTLITACLTTYPLEIVRVRLMMQSGRADPMYTGTLDCFKKILKNEGLRGFYKGSLIILYRATSGPLGLVIYDRIKAS